MKSMEYEKVNTFKLSVVVTVVMLVANLDPVTAQDNPGHKLASSMSDYERAQAFADLVNKNPKLHCIPSHTKFLGMRPDKRAGYVLYCQDGGEFLMIMHPDEAMTVQIHWCLIIIVGGTCEEEWELIE